MDSPTDENLLVHPSFIGDAGGDIQRKEGLLCSDLLDDRDCLAEPEKWVLSKVNLELGEVAAEKNRTMYQIVADAILGGEESIKFLHQKVWRSEIISAFIATTLFLAPAAIEKHVWRSEIISAFITTTLFLASAAIEKHGQVTHSLEWHDLIKALNTSIPNAEDKDTSAEGKGQSLTDIPPPDRTLDDDYARIRKRFLLLFFSTSIDELGRRATESGRVTLGNEQSVEINDEESMDEDTSPQGDVQVKGKFIRTLPGMLQYNVEAEPTEWLWRLQFAHKFLKEEDSRAFIFDPDVSRDALFSIVYGEPDLPVSKDLEGTDIVRAEAGHKVSSILSKQSVSEVEEIMNAKGCYPFPVRSSESSDVSP
ncbi:hypothetical protein A7U60_g4683 [Sanghuangporus baumii]|uniref:Uncharacterized protein n=1 Tax=Sanghuangporus baumii TaxID=108892 RepID=A0A9Q5HY47_SANBA|nr:hypothetical protein A7U60_g4683 [Sanghuangporus baumii]